MVVYTFNVIEEIGSRRERERSMQVMLPLYVRSGPGHIATTFKPIQVYSIIYNKRLAWKNSCSGRSEMNNTNWSSLFPCKPMPSW